MTRAQTYQAPKGKTKNGIIPVPIIVNGTNTHNSGDVAKQGSVRANLLGIIPFAKKLFSKKKEPAPAPRKPNPEGELVISFYDSTKELLSTEILSLKSENEWETLAFSAKAEEKGFVSASIRGTSTEPAKFDDFSIQLKSLYSAKLYQENHYYPFGMNMKGLESSDKQTQQNKKEHEFQFNAQTEREESFGLFWDETPFRAMDMQLGRFWGVDKLSEVTYGLTPFHYAMNNPISGNDPTGLITKLDIPDNDYSNGFWDKLRGGSPFNQRRRTSSVGIDFFYGSHKSPFDFDDGKIKRQSQVSDTDPPPGTEELAEENAVTAPRIGGDGASFTGIPRGVGSLTPPMGAYEHFKNRSASSLLRTLAPELLFGEVGSSYFYGPGATMSPVGTVLMLEGPDANLMGLYSDVGGGIGWDPGSVSFTGGAGWYTGDDSNLTIDGSVAGPRLAFDIGWKSLGELSLFLSVTEKDRYGGRIISLGLSGGFSIPNPAGIGGSVNWGATRVHTSGNPTMVIPELIKALKEL